MATYRIHTRSFHPAKTFGSAGLGFSGDDRGFSLAESGVTSRIRHTMDIDLPGARIIAGRVISDPSHHEGMGVTQDYSDPAKQPTATVEGTVSPYNPDGDQRFEVTMSYRGQNFAFPGADWEVDIPYTPFSISPRHGIGRTVPDLDVTNHVTGYVNRAERKLNLNCDLKGDGFPNAETFMLDTPKAPLAMCTHIRVGVALTQLFGDRRLPMGRCMVELDVKPDDSFSTGLKNLVAIDFAGDGSPVDLAASLGRNTSRTAWNAMHTGRVALGPESRRNMDNSIWDGLKQRWGW
jgi:hypothetical protein